MILPLSMFFAKTAKRLTLSFKQIEWMLQKKQIKAMILCLSSSMDKKFLVSVLNMFVHKIKKYI